MARVIWTGSVRPAVQGALASLLLVAATDGPGRAQSPAGGPLTLAEVVRTTLAASADVETARLEMQRQAGALRATRGTFDPRVWATAIATQDRVLSAPVPEASGSASPSRITEPGTTMEYGLGVDHRLRAGVVVSPRVLLARTGVPGSMDLPQNRASASLGVLLPLGRGWGGGVAVARERAAGVAYRASSADLRHRSAQSVLRAVRAYWGYVAAVRKREVLRESEQRAAKLVEETRTLIAADERPAVDLVPVQANLASRRAARLAGEQAVTQARRELGTAMGISADSLQALPSPELAFPTLPETVPADAVLARAAVEQALRQRADLAAVHGRRAAAQDLLKGVRNELRPQVDVNLRVGYTGAEDGREVSRLVTPFAGAERGLHASVQLSYGLPLGNRAAGGEAMQTAAADREAEVAAAELTRKIELDAAAAAETFRRSIEELALASEAVRLHASAVEGETQKFRLGTSTLFEVMAAEESLTSATLIEIDSRVRYATSLAQLRFEAGTLIGGESGDRVAVDALTGFTEHPRS
ncbi:MAG TPA: TolC family protein [Longimicrobiaceae bacterium]|nr:TolC family protein [Longimicrobiaceae bacterium]